MYYAMLSKTCYDILCCAIYYTTLRYVNYIMLCSISSYAMSCYAKLSYAMLSYAMLCYVMYHAMPYKYLTLKELKYYMVN